MKNGTPRHPHRLGLLDFLAHQVGVSAIGEPLFDLTGVEAAIAGDFDQHAAVADVATLDEIGLEQPIGDFGLDAGFARPSE